MNPQEALAVAVRVAGQTTTPGWTPPQTYPEMAAAILAALPEGWRLVWHEEIAKAFGDGYAAALAEAVDERLLLVLEDDVRVDIARALKQNGIGGDGDGAREYCWEVAGDIVTALRSRYEKYLPSAKEKP